MLNRKPYPEEARGSLINTNSSVNEYLITLQT